MKSAVILSFAAVAFAALIEKRECAGNNCKRQVTGTRAGLLPITSRQADCSSFMANTVVPDATTTTVTVTAAYYDDDEETPIQERAIQARATTQVPTAIPAYASSCTNIAEYSSACSCWGITAVTVTAPQPTSTETVTVTEEACENIWG